MSRDINSLGLSYSIARLVEEETGIDATIRIDGMEYPEYKPFIIVTELPSVISGLSKAKEAMSVTYSFQLDVFSDTGARLRVINNQLLDLVMFGSFPYYNENGEKTNVTLSFDDNSIISPLYAENITNKTEYHTSHVEANVTITKHINKGDV